MSNIHIVSGAKLFEWINKFYPYIYEMKCISINQNKYIYSIRAKLFSCPYHTLVRDKIEVQTILEKNIPIGEFFHCYQDQYTYKLKETNCDMI